VLPTHRLAEEYAQDAARPSAAESLSLIERWIDGIAQNLPEFGREAEAKEAQMASGC
jgi:hypothetical protein